MKAFGVIALRARVPKSNPPSIAHRPIEPGVFGFEFPLQRTTLAHVIVFHRALFAIEIRLALPQFGEFGFVARGYIGQFGFGLRKRRAVGPRLGRRLRGRFAASASRRRFGCRLARSLALWWLQALAARCDMAARAPWISCLRR